MTSLGFLSPRNSFLTPIPELDQAANLLDEAVGMIVSQRDDRARELIDQADIPALYTFAASITVAINPDVHRVRNVPNTPPTLPKADRAPVMVSNSPLGKEIFKRDGWRCRFCECRVIPAEIRKEINSRLPGAIRWSQKSIEGCYTGFMALWGSIDHILPHSRGGDNDPSNLVTACFVCQFGRMAYTLEQVGIIDPRTRQPIVGQWDGLVRLIGNTQRAVVAKPIKAGFSVQATFSPASEAELLDRLSSDKTREAASLLTNWLRQIGCKVGLISGQKSISASVANPGQKPVRVLELDRYGKVWIGLGNLVEMSAFPDETFRRQYLQQLRAVSSLHLSAAEKYPTFPLDDLMQTNAWVGLQAVVSDIVARLQTNPA